MTVPSFHEQEAYDSWIESMAETEARELVNEYEEEELTHDTVYQFIGESGYLTFNRGEILDGYFDVLRFSRFDAEPTTITLPKNDPISGMRTVMTQLVRRDLEAETIAQLEERGIDLE